MLPVPVLHAVSIEQPNRLLFRLSISIHVCQSDADGVTVDFSDTDAQPGRVRLPDRLWVRFSEHNADRDTGADRQLDAVTQSGRLAYSESDWLNELVQVGYPECQPNRDGLSDLDAFGDAHTIPNRIRHHDA